MTDSVLFDLFGVIACHQSAEGKDRLVELAGAPAQALRDAYWTLRPPYDRGQLSGPDYWRRIADTLGTRFGDDRIAELIAADIASWSAVDDAMVALVEELARQGRRLGLLSNIPEELAADFEARHPWLEHFEVVGFSCRIGHTKPDPEAYRWSQRALGTEPRRVLFVDDRQDNVRAAEAAGMRGHVFTTLTRLRRVLDR